LSFYCYLLHLCYFFKKIYSIFLIIYNITFLTTSHKPFYKKNLSFFNLSKTSHFSLSSLEVISYNINVSKNQSLPLSLLLFSLGDTSIFTFFSFLFFCRYLLTLFLIFFFSGFVLIVPSSLHALRFCI